MTIRFQDIKKYTREANYSVTIGWSYLESHIESQMREENAAKLDLDPDFQRAHVWDDAKRSRYVEHILRGGVGARDILLNCAGWMSDFRGPYVLVDGKQRLEAVRRFLRDEIPVVFPELTLGRHVDIYHSDFRDRIRDMVCYFNWKVNDLPTRVDVLRWYLEINSGGVVHTPEELQRVRELLVREGYNAKRKA